MKANKKLKKSGKNNLGQENLIGFFNLLLQIDKRKNPNKYKIKLTNKSLIKNI